MHVRIFSDIAMTPTRHYASDIVCLRVPNAIGQHDSTYIH